jgi:transcriptional regulator with XRE-family HTH domain
MARPSLTPDDAPAALVDAVATLGANIATARRRRGLRQRDLAEKAGIARGTLIRVEAGELATGIAAFAAALWAMGLLDALADLADPAHDEVGLTLEAARAGGRVRVDGGLSDDF